MLACKAIPHNTNCWGTEAALQMQLYAQALGLQASPTADSAKAGVPAGSVKGQTVKTQWSDFGNLVVLEKTYLDMSL